MTYYKLGQDQRIPYSVLLTELSKIGGYFDSESGDLSTLDKVIVSVVSSSPINFYPDILDRQIFMIKGAVKEVFDMFLPELAYKHCVLLDKPEKRSEQYFIPVLDMFDMQGGLQRGKHIFRIADSKEKEVAASLEAVEAILRRAPEGVRISAIS